jgi:apolipoprotein N-acyltransferase
MLIILGMIFLNPLLHALGWLAIALGVIFFIPIIIFAVIVGVVAIMALVILSALGIPLRIGRRHAYRRWYRRGPWSW